jgi:5'-methylthioinosine phosphorylase
MAEAGKQYAIIAGSGFRSFGNDSVVIPVSTKYGDPAGPVRELQYEDHTVYLLPRHGEDLLTPPHAINYRANMQALHQLGTECAIGVNTVGVIARHIDPGQIVVPDQLIDYTWGREHSIYDGIGSLEHVDMTNPFAEHLRQELMEAARHADVDVHDGGVYAVTQGPRLETAAEVSRLEQDGADYVGMTAMPEAVLARELGMDYACLSLVVNYAAGRGEKSIHADIEASTMTAKMQAMKILRVFFGVMDE